MPVDLPSAIRGALDVVVPPLPLETIHARALRGTRRAQHALRGYAAAAVMGIALLLIASAPYVAPPSNTAVVAVPAPRPIPT